MSLGASPRKCGVSLDSRIGPFWQKTARDSPRPRLVATLQFYLYENSTSRALRARGAHTLALERPSMPWLCHAPAVASREFIDMAGSFLIYMISVHKYIHVS